MKNKRSTQLSALRQLIVKHFSESELRTLSFDLGLDYESLPGREKSEKARELIIYCVRTNELTDLLQACKKARPKVEWPHVTDNHTLLVPAQPTTIQQTIRIGVGLLIIVGVLLFIFLNRSRVEPQDDQANSDPIQSLVDKNCFDTYFEDIQPDYRESVAVGETAHDFYFSDWDDRENPSLLGLRLIESGEPVAAIRFIFLPGNSPSSVAFEVVGAIDENCEEVGDYFESPLLIENWRHLLLELPEKKITVSFNWQGDRLRFGVRQLREP